jgi:hypothetical protein
VAAVRPALMGTAAHVLRRLASTSATLAGGRRVPLAAGRASSIRQHSLLYLLVRGEQRRFYTVFCDAVTFPRRVFLRCPPSTATRRPPLQREVGQKSAPSSRAWRERFWVG